MTKKNKKIISSFRIDNILYYLAAFLMPSILLLDLYNRNHAENQIVFIYILILAGVLAVTGVLQFEIIKRIINSIEGALVLSVLFWLLFWLFEASFSIALRYFDALTSIGFMVLLGASFVFLIWLFRRYKPPFIKMRPAFNILAISLIVLFVFNFIPAINHEIFLRTRNELTFSEEHPKQFYMKKDFFIDSTLPAPDIMWLHLDGMMSLETVEWFWGESQEYLREELRERGFVIYQNAELNAAGTFSALTALYSPAFYDSFWGDVLERYSTELRNPRIGNLIDALAEVGLVFVEDIVPYYELLLALISRGYRIEIIGGTGWGGGNASVF